MVYNNQKVGAIFGLILLFVFKTSICNSPNFQYLEIFEFIRIYYMCFSDKGLLEIYSVLHKKLPFSSMPIIRYIDSKTMLI